MPPHMGPSDLPVYELSQLSLFNSLSFGVWVASFAPGASKYIFANDKCTEMFGQSREHMVSSTTRAYSVACFWHEPLRSRTRGM